MSAYSAINYFRTVLRRIHTEFGKVGRVVPPPCLKQVWKQKVELINIYNVWVVRRSSFECPCNSFICCSVFPISHMFPSAHLLTRVLWRNQDSVEHEMVGDRFIVLDEVRVILRSKSKVFPNPKLQSLI